MQLEGRVALVTGAGSGIGLASAVELAKEGAKIAAFDVSADALADAVAQIERGGGEAMPVAVDVSHPEQMRTAIERVGERWGRIDIVFANAGINGVWAPLEDLEPEEWDRTLAINLKGTFLTVKYALPYLKHRGGSVIVTSSVNGTRIFSNTGATAYSCSKGGQVIFTQMAALELARYKIRVNAICPGAIETNIDQRTEQRNTDEVKIPVEFPEGSFPLADGPGTPEEVAQLVLFLASDASRHITGTPVWIEGAESLLQG